MMIKSNMRNEGKEFLKVEENFGVFKGRRKFWRF
jgi:hypothetical protein